MQALHRLAPRLRALRSTLGTLQRTRWPARLAFALCVFVGTWATLWLFAHDAPVAGVQASATWNDERAFLPSHTLDHSTLELGDQRGNFWLLPDHQTGWIRFDLAKPYAVDRVSLLNTRNAHYKDRGTTRYRVALISPGRRTVFQSGTLDPYPGWAHLEWGGIKASEVLVSIDGYVENGGGLNEVLVEGHPQGFLGAWRDELVALLAATLATFLFVRVTEVWKKKLPIPKAVFVACAAGIIVASSYFLRLDSALSSFDWMNLFDVKDLHTWGDVRVFFKELRVPIPPVLALVEVLDYRIAGNDWFVSVWEYRTSIIASYVLAVMLAYPRRRRMVFVAALSLPFVWATSVIHPACPQLYDVFLPFCALATLVALRGALGAHGKLPIAYAAMAGLALALFGLTRPISFFLMPLPIGVFLWSSIRPAPGPAGDPGTVPLRGAIRSRRWRAVAFFAPVVILFGTWHAYGLVAHRQLTMSNNAGFNLHRAFPMVPTPKLVEERTTAPYRAGNNPDHGENSARIQRAIVAFCVAHPFGAAMNVLDRLAAMTAPSTKLGPDAEASMVAAADPGLALYRWVAHLAFLSVFVGMGCDAILISLRRRRRTTATYRIESLALWLAGGCTFLFALGEAGEESRFAISVLPLLTLAPVICADRARELLRRARPASAGDRLAVAGAGRGDRVARDAVDARLLPRQE